MTDKRSAPPAAAPIDSDTPSSADRLRVLLRFAGMSQRAAARYLNVDERTMRMWCAGQGVPPEFVFRALSPRLTHTEHLKRLVERNEETIGALRDGRITGLGFGPGLSDPGSAAAEIRRLELRNEEHLALIRVEEAFHRRQEAHSPVYRQWRPHGTGAVDLDDIDELEEADSEFRAAQAEVDRITEEIRAGKRR